MKCRLRSQPVSRQNWNAPLFLRVMWICTSALLVLVIAAQVSRMYHRKLALDELIARVEASGNGSVSISTPGNWNLLQYTGLNERWYFSHCYVRCKQADGGDGSFLAQLSDTSLDIITEFHAVDNFFDAENLLHINRMTNLTALNMDLSYLPDRILSSLNPENLPYLTEVHMASNGFGVTDGGIEGSSIIPQLRVLDINHCEGVTNKSVLALSNGGRLQDLFIEGTGITDKGFRHLEQRLGAQTISWRPRK